MLGRILGYPPGLEGITMADKKMCPHCSKPITYRKEYYTDEDGEQTGDYDVVPECMDCGAEWG